MGSSFVSLPAKRPLSSSSSSSFSFLAETQMSDPNPNPANGSSKRSKQQPQQQQPLSVPPGHAAFRLLCHASRIGGVIGKSGSVIKQLQQATGAKIRIDEAIPDSSDRVVVVVAPSAVVSKISVGNANAGFEGAGGGEMEVSKAQEALLRVFDRILEVAAESGAVDMDVGVVSCRLLADTTQVGSVIGKAGKVVERIRKDSGCKIRVLTEKLPACAASTDEMVEVSLFSLYSPKRLSEINNLELNYSEINKSLVVFGSGMR